MLINIRANWQNAKNGMNSVLGHARGVSSGIGNAFNRVKSAIGSVAGMFGMGLGAAAAVAGVKKLIDKMDEIEDNAPKLGVTFAYFQKMQFAAERTGTSFSAVTARFTRIKKLAGDFAAGDKTATDAFRMIGMSVQDLADKSPEKIFDEITKRLNAIEDPLLRDAAASQFLGKNFTELNNFLKDHIELGKELENRGAIITDDQIMAASQFKDSISNIQFSLQAWSVNSGFITQLAQIAEGLDAIVSTSKKMEKAGIKSDTESYKKNEGFLQKSARWAMNLATIPIDPIAKLITGKKINAGDMLFGALNERMSTAAVNRDDIKNKIGGPGDDAALKKQVNEAAQYEAKVQSAVTARSRASELKALDDVQNKAKVTPKTALAKAQSAMATGAATASTAKLASDSLQRIGGYSGGMKATQALDVAKKQVDILTQVDRKLASIESSAKSGGLVFT